MSIEPAATPDLNPPPSTQRSGSKTVWLALGVAALALLASLVLWTRLSSVQELLARQTSDSGAAATEARSSARQAEELSRDTAARLALAEAKINELNAQRAQLDQWVQSLSKARDETLLSDFESALRLAQQQSELGGSLQPMVTTLRSLEQRLAKQNNARFIALQRALARDIERLNSVSVPDTPSILVRMDDLMQQIDRLALVNDIKTTANPEPVTAQPLNTWQKAINRDWWSQLLRGVWQDVQGLVRVSRIDQPEAALLAPEQSFFLRENMKLRLLNARLSLISRQHDTVRSDLQKLQRDFNHYFDLQDRTVRASLLQLQQLQAELKPVKWPRIDETTSALDALNARP